MNSRSILNRFAILCALVRALSANPSFSSQNATLASLQDVPVIDLAKDELESIGHISLGGTPFCSAFSISRNSILTAAHCIDARLMSTYSFTNRTKNFALKKILTYDKKQDIAEIEVAGEFEQPLALGSHKDFNAKFSTIMVKYVDDKYIQSNNVMLEADTDRGTKLFLHKHSSRSGLSGSPIFQFGKVVGLHLGASAIDWNFGIIFGAPGIDYQEIYMIQQAIPVAIVACANNPFCASLVLTSLGGVLSLIDKYVLAPWLLEGKVANEENFKGAADGVSKGKGTIVQMNKDNQALAVGGNDVVQINISAGGSSGNGCHTVKSVTVIVGGSTTVIVDSSGRIISLTSSSGTVTQKYLPNCQQSNTLTLLNNYQLVSIAIGGSIYQMYMDLRGFYPNDATLETLGSLAIKGKGIQIKTEKNAICGTIPGHSYKTRSTTCNPGYDFHSDDADPKYIGSCIKADEAKTCDVSYAYGYSPAEIKSYIIDHNL